MSIPSVRFNLRMLCVVTALTCCLLSYQRWQQQRRAEIAARYHSFRELLAATDYGSAYAMMTPEYQQRHSVTEFSKQFDTPLPSLQPACGIWFRGGQAEVYPHSTRFLELLNGETYTLQRGADGWLFTGDTKLYLD